jgi:uncharacterized protein (TIGR00297 family)
LVIGTADIYNTMPFILLTILLSTAALITVLTHKLTIVAAVTGVLVALVIFKGAGYTGLILMAAFFILGTVATTFGIQQKLRHGIAETNKGKRNAAQVLANAGVAAIIGVGAWKYPQWQVLCSLMIAAAFSSATADTLSSELGNIFGKRYYNILSFKKDTRGLNGVISLEGTLCGLAGSIVIATIYALGLGWNVGFIIIIIAGTFGNIMDSILGATLERSGTVGNNVVNFSNTLLAAVVAGAMNLLFR